MRLRAASPLLLALVLLPGCAELLGACDPVETATWRHPGLHDALAASGQETHLHAPPPGMPLESDALRARHGDVPLHAVRWTPGGSARDGVMATLAPGPRISMTVPADMTDDALRETFRAFVRNVSAAPERWDEWESTLVDSRREDGWVTTDGTTLRPISHGAEVNVTGPFRLDALVADLGGADALQPALHARPGGLDLRADDWTFSLRVPVREYRFGTEEGTLTLLVDAADQVEASLARRDGATAPRLPVLLDEALAPLGMGPIGLGPSSVRVAVC